MGLDVRKELEKGYLTPFFVWNPLIPTIPMNFSAVLPTFLITLREGVEAALVVGIVLAYLQKANQRRLYPWVYGGIGIGILGSVLVGVLFLGLMQRLGNGNQPDALVLQLLLKTLFEGVAIALLSWMLIWMTQQARQMQAEVEAVVDSALQQHQQAGWGILGLVGTAVLREGFETVVFIAAQFQEGILPILGALGGLAVAVGIGILLFQLGVKINLRLFFQVMGVFLLLIIGGLVISMLRHLDQTLLQASQLLQGSDAWCLWGDRPRDNAACILGPQVWDTSAVLPDRQFPGIILHTLVGYTQHLYLLQALAYGLFWLTVGGLIFKVSPGESWGCSLQDLPRSRLPQAQPPSDLLRFLPAAIDRPCYALSGSDLCDYNA